MKIYVYMYIDIYIYIFFLRTTAQHIFISGARVTGDGAVTAVNSLEPSILGWAEEAPDCPDSSVPSYQAIYPK